MYLFVYMCTNHCHRVFTQLQLTNTSKIQLFFLEYFSGFPWFSTLVRPIWRYVALQGRIFNIQFLKNKSLFWSPLSPHEVWAWRFSAPVYRPHPSSLTWPQNRIYPAKVWTRNHTQSTAVLHSSWNAIMFSSNALKRGVSISMCKKSLGGADRSEFPDIAYRQLSGRCTVTSGWEVLVGGMLNIRRPIWQLGSPFNTSEMKMSERSYSTPYKLHTISDLN
jgi:hypothetical protein